MSPQIGHPAAAHNLARKTGGSKHECQSLREAVPSSWPTSGGHRLLRAEAAPPLWLLGSDARLAVRRAPAVAPSPGQTIVGYQVVEPDSGCNCDLKMEARGPPSRLDETTVMGRRVTPCASTCQAGERRAVPARASALT